MNITYSLLGINEDGDPVVDITLPSTTAAAILLRAVEEGVARVEMVGVEPIVLCETVAQKKKALDGAIEEYPGRKSKKKVRKCSQCGGAGHTSRTCDERQAPKDKKYEALMEDQYDEAVSLFKIEQSTKEVADQTGLPLKEVNRACKAGSFASYMASYLDHYEEDKI